MKLKILTLNIWRYYDWEKRKKKVINFLKEQNADIVFIQEAAFDERLKEKYENQVDEINKELNYGSFNFLKMRRMTKWHEKPIDWEMWYGLGILSKFPIKKSELVILPHVKKDKNSGFLHTKAEISHGDLDLINVHFENTDEGSKEHLKYVLEWCKKRNIKPIIAGDFNMRKTGTLIELSDKEYGISYKLKPYFSFMPTDFSNNKEPITLDYILAHKEKFKVLDVKCTQNNISDHNPVIAFLELI
ncbi:MAG: endonuclease/exonuclease/phosphatase family protein [Nanoarchaeota archaeon]